MGKQIYVEILVRAPLDTVWNLTQQPDLHSRWDLRFSSIVPLTDGPPQEFRYEFRLPLHTVHGTGVSLGGRTGAGGAATSVLKFSTKDPLSPIGPGAGYWRYVPANDGGTRFITGYDFAPGWGRIGTWLDKPLIRPLLGWATAWSFDRLRLWAEEELDPRCTRNRWLLDGGTRLGAVATGVILVFRRPRPATVLTAFAAAAAASLIPRHPSIPRADRCLRNPPDRRAGQAPSSLASLAEPA
ncbi:SRPBCC family protein [Arthrobacter sp. Sa2CUA1]|uniref:SRPBCC family protein n=1 Tax=Arthrobacter gallicola TaxID=2762225 RepID=A0ABR8UW95_9MICC|nr:SRPBCC family protein [Arthrobacter gallicola]MBD7996516.1 SRPBCC family protein [Arthrobacter gallicola]